MGTGGREAERKGAGGGRREGWIREVPRWREPREIEEISQHFVIFLNRNGTKRRESLRKGVGSGSKNYGKREKKIREAGVSEPPPPPPPPFYFTY